MLIKIAVDGLWFSFPELALKNKLVHQLLQKSEYTNVLKNNLKIKPIKILIKFLSENTLTL